MICKLTSSIKGIKIPSIGKALSQPGDYIVVVQDGVAKKFKINSDTSGLLNGTGNITGVATITNQGFVILAEDGLTRPSLPAEVVQSGDVRLKPVTVDNDGLVPVLPNDSGLTINGLGNWSTMSPILSSDFDSDVQTKIENISGSTTLGPIQTLVNAGNSNQHIMATFNSGNGGILFGWIQGLHPNGQGVGVRVRQGSTTLGYASISSNQGSQRTSLCIPIRRNLNGIQLVNVLTNGADWTAPSGMTRNFYYRPFVYS